MDQTDRDSRDQFRREATRVLGTNLRRLRVARGLTQEGLSEKAGLARVHVGMIENGKRLPALDTIFQLIRVLDIRLEDLLEGIDFRPQRGGAEPESNDAPDGQEQG